MIRWDVIAGLAGAYLCGLLAGLLLGIRLWA
jgi:hypothetical protein